MSRRPDKFRVLVFTKTDGERRPSIRDGVQTIRELARDNGFQVTVTQDAAAFTAENLARFRAVVFLNTIGNVLNPAQEAAFEGYIRAGGGYVGVHAAAETEPDWAFYQQLVGTKVASVAGVEPRQRPGRRPRPPVDRDRAAHAHTDRGVVQLRGQRARQAARTRHRRREVVHRRHHGLRPPGRLVPDYVGGRSWYTGLGHSIESYRNRGRAQAPARRHRVGRRRGRGRLRRDRARQLREGHAQRRARRADVARRPAGRPGAAQHPRRRDPALRPGQRRQPDHHQRSRLQPRRGRPADPVDRPGLRVQQMGLHLLLTQAEHPGGRPVDTGGQRGRRAGHQHGPDHVGQVQGLQPAVPLQVRGDADPAPGPGERAADHPGARRPGHLLPRGRQGQVRRQGHAVPDHRRRHQRRRLGRLHAHQRRGQPGPALDARRSSGNTNDLRGKLLRIKVRANGTYTIPNGNLFPESAGPRRTRRGRRSS